MFNSTGLLLLPMVLPAFFEKIKCGRNPILNFPDARFLHPVRQGVATAKAQASDQTGNILQGQATIFDEDGKPVLKFSSTFKIARDRAIRGIEWREPRKTRE